MNVSKILEEGLPPKNTSEWKIIKYLVNNGGKSNVKDLINNIFNGVATINNRTHIYRVLSNMDKDGNIKLKTHPGKAMMIEITDAGIASFDVYIRKNIQIQGDNETSENKNQIIPERSMRERSMGAVKKRIINILEKNSEVIFNEMRNRIQKEFNITENAVKKSLKELVIGGYLEEKHVICLKNCCEEK